MMRKNQRPSPHAIQRFRERTGSEKSDEKIRLKLLALWANAKEVKLKREYRAIALLNHGLREARYFRAGGFVLVIENDQISTVHNGEAGRWENA